MKKQLTNEINVNLESETLSGTTAVYSVPFTSEHMLTLLTIYAAYGRLKKLVLDLAGDTADFSYGNSIMGDLSNIETLIADLSPVYNPQEDCDDSYFYSLLDNPDIPADVKAMELLTGRQ